MNSTKKFCYFQIPIQVYSIQVDLAEYRSLCGSGNNRNTLLSSLQSQYNKK